MSHEQSDFMQSGLQKREARNPVVLLADTPSEIGLTREILTNNGFTPHIAESWPQTVAASNTLWPSIIVVDTENLKIEPDRVRDLGKPFIVTGNVHSRYESEARIRALDSGADYFLAKPTEDSLASYIRVSLRQSEPIERPQIIRGAYGIVVDFAKMRVFVGGNEVKFTSTEWNILSRLSLSAGNVVPNAEMRSRIWGFPGWGEDEVTHSLRVYINSLRNKLNKASEGSGRVIQTRWRDGYMFVGEAPPLRR